MSLSEEESDAGDIVEGIAVSFFITLAGLAFLFLGGSDVTTDSLLYRRFGLEGADLITRAIGAVVTLAGGLWFGLCVRRLFALKRRRERYLPPFRPNDRG